MVDRKDTQAAIAQVISLTEGRLRYAIDAVGKETATFALQALSKEGEVFLVGLSGLPKEVPRNVRLCDVPVKTFHTNAAVGAGLMRLLEDLIASKELVLPPVEVIEGGLEAVNVSSALFIARRPLTDPSSCVGWTRPVARRQLLVRATRRSHSSRLRFAWLC